MTERLRVATPDDAAAILDIYAPHVRGSAVTFETEVPSVETMRERVREGLERYPWLVAERDGTVVGYASAGPLRKKQGYDWVTELSVYLAEQAQGEGLGRRLYQVLLAILDAQGFVAAYGAVTLPNPASVRLHESLGFERVGQFPGAGYVQSAWHDVRWYALELGERPAEPERPTPFGETDADGPLGGPDP